jgi:mRNA interferase MazF
MVTPSAGEIVLVPFPFTDLSQSKLRPALVLADAGRRDWVLCQITSNPYSDPDAIALFANDLRTGFLQATSFARPGKLFTAHETLIVSSVGILNAEPFDRVLEAVVEIIRPSVP